MPKTALLTILLAALGAAAQAQDAPHRFEIGLETATYSPLAEPYPYAFFNSDYTPKLRGVSGALARYHVGRLGLRFSGSYTTNTIQSDTKNCADCLVGYSKGQEFQLRLGGQYAPLAAAPWLYAFSDFYYRRYTSAGNFTGGFCGCLDSDTQVMSNGVGNATGLGVKLRTWKRFYLNPEVYYDVLRARNANTSVDNRTGQTYTSRSRTSLQQPSLRLNVLVTF